MSDLTLQAPPAAPQPPESRRSPWAMLISVLTEPRAVFESLRARPAWLQPLLVFWLLATGTAYIAGFKSMDLILAQAMQASQGADSAQVAQMEKIVRISAYASPPFSTLIALLISSLLMAGILALLGTMLGGEGTFKQTWAATLYAAVPSAVIGIIVTGLMMLTTPASALKGVSTSLAILLPADAFGSGLYHFLSILDPFDIYGLALLTIGYAVVMRFTAKKAAFITVPLWLVGKGIAIAMTALSLSLSKMG